MESIIQTEQPALIALNETLRDSYIADCERALARWNKIIREAGVELRAQAAASWISALDRRVRERQRDAGRADSQRTRNGSGANRNGCRRKPIANSSRR